MERRNAVPDGFERELGPGGLEVRTLPGVERIEAREASASSGPGITGYGSVSGVRTTIEGWWDEWDEEVAPGAWAKTIAEGDIRSMFNHDVNRLLGRTTAGTLRLSEDDAGLLYDVDINAMDANAMSVHAQVARGDVSGSSVWFRVIRQEWTVATEDNGLERDLRRILEAMLFETGPVTFPAFVTTTANARSLALLDRTLRSVSPRTARRARDVADLLSDPAAFRRELRGLDEELAELLESRPELRDAVCSCPPTSRAAAEAPGSSTGTPPAGHLPTPAQYQRRARGLAARYGLSPIPGGSE